VVCCCAYGNELSVSVRCRNFFFNVLGIFSIVAMSLLSDVSLLGKAEDMWMLVKYFLRTGNLFELFFSFPGDIGAWPHHFLILTFLVTCECIYSGSGNCQILNCCYIAPATHSAFHYFQKLLHLISERFLMHEKKIFL
jgi:hypothetical protein